MNILDPYIMITCMHTINSCQNTTCQYLTTNPTTCKLTQHPQTPSFQPLSGSFSLSIDTTYNIPNGATQHHQSTASYFVVFHYNDTIQERIATIQLHSQTNKYKCTYTVCGTSFFTFEKTINLQWVYEFIS